MTAPLWRNLETAEDAVSKARAAIVDVIAQRLEADGTTAYALAQQAKITHRNLYALLHGRWNANVAQKALHALGITR